MLLPQGDRPAGEALVSRQRGASRRVRPRPLTALQRQGVAADHAEAQANPAHWPSRSRASTLRRAVRSTAPPAPPRPEGSSSPGWKWPSGARGELTPPRPSGPTAQWETLRDDRSTPRAPTPVATLSISFRGPGTLWMDQVSLCRRQGVRLAPGRGRGAPALRPGMIRFGGTTTEGFHWRDTVGDPDRAGRLPPLGRTTAGQRGSGRVRRNSAAGSARSR